MPGLTRHFPVPRPAGALHASKRQSCHLVADILRMFCRLKPCSPTSNFLLRSSLGENGALNLKNAVEAVARVTKVLKMGEKIIRFFRKRSHLYGEEKSNDFFVQIRRFSQPQ